MRCFRILFSSVFAIVLFTSLAITSSSKAYALEDNEVFVPMTCTINNVSVTSERLNNFSISASLGTGEATNSVNSNLLAFQGCDIPEGDNDDYIFNFKINGDAQLPTSNYYYKLANYNTVVSINARRSEVINDYSYNQNSQVQLNGFTSNPPSELPFPILKEQWQLWHGSVIFNRNQNFNILIKTMYSFFCYGAPAPGCTTAGVGQVSVNFSYPLRFWITKKIDNSSDKIAESNNEANNDENKDSSKFVPDIDNHFSGQIINIIDALASPATSCDFDMTLPNGDNADFSQLCSQKLYPSQFDFLINFLLTLICIPIICFLFYKIFDFFQQKGGN